MFYIRSSWASFKVKWVSRALKNPNLLWARILNDEIKAIMPQKSLKDFLSFSIGDLQYISKNIGPIFWKQTFRHFTEAYISYLKQNPELYILSHFWEDICYKNNGRKLQVSNLTKPIRDSIMFPIQLIQRVQGSNPTFRSGAPLCLTFSVPLVRMKQ